MADDTKTVREIVFYYADHRARGEHGAYGEGFLVEPEKGETAEWTGLMDPFPSPTLRITKASGEVVIVAPGWLWFTDHTREAKKYVPNAEKPSIVRSSD